MFLTVGPSPQKLRVASVEGRCFQRQLWPLVRAAQAEALPFFTDNFAAQLTEVPSAVDHKDPSLFHNVLLKIVWSFERWWRLSFPVFVGICDGLGGNMATSVALWLISLWSWFLWWFRSLFIMNCSCRLKHSSVMPHNPTYCCAQYTRSFRMKLKKMMPFSPHQQARRKVATRPQSLLHDRNQDEDDDAEMHPFIFFEKYCWWLKSCTTWDVKAPVNKWEKLPAPTAQDFSHQHEHVYSFVHTQMFFAFFCDLSRPHCKCGSARKTFQCWG